MEITPDWAGRITGTNTGNIFLKIIESTNNDGLSGDLRLNDDRLGLFEFNISGSFNGSILQLDGTVRNSPETAIISAFKANASLDEKGNLIGDWQTPEGTAGRLFLVPQSSVSSPSHTPDQLHNAEYEFSHIEIDKNAVIELAECIQSESEGDVVITTIGQTEQSCYIEKFKSQQFPIESFKVLKIRSHSDEAGGISRIIHVEFGPITNIVSVQSTDQVRAHGIIDILKIKILSYQKKHITFFKKTGVIINQLLLLALLVLMPSIDSLAHRIFSVLVFIAALALYNFTSNNLLRNANIYLGEKKPKKFPKVIIAIVLWGLGIVSTIGTALITSFFKSILGLN